MDIDGQVRGQTMQLQAVEHSHPNSVEGSTEGSSAALTISNSTALTSGAARSVSGAVASAAAEVASSTAECMRLAVPPHVLECPGLAPLLKGKPKGCREKAGVGKAWVGAPATPLHLARGSLAMKPGIVADRLRIA